MVRWGMGCLKSDWTQTGTKQSREECNLWLFAAIFLWCWNKWSAEVGEWTSLASHHAGIHVLQSCHRSYHIQHQQSYQYLLLSFFHLDLFKKMTMTLLSSCKSFFFFLTIFCDDDHKMENNYRCDSAMLTQVTSQYGPGSVPKTSLC